MWKGGKTPNAFPHVCPYRLNGVDQKTCVDLSGSNYHQNRNGCCGASRGSAYFEPCNSEMRRCIVCIQLGRRGLKANAVTNVSAGTCDEHAKEPAKPSKSTYVPTLATRIATSVVRKNVVVDISKPAVRAKPVEKTPQITLESPQKVESGKKNRAQEIFGIFLEVREEMEKAGKPAPHKRKLAAEAAGRLGMAKRSAEVYIYQHLKKEQIEKLKLAPNPTAPLFSRDEKIAILKKVREEMEQQGLPFVRHMDLAKAAAPLLKQEEGSVSTYITGLPEEVRKELDLGGSNSRKLAGLDAATVRAGFLGAIAVLKMQRIPATRENLKPVLRLQSTVIEKYLADNPDVRVLLEEKPSPP